MDYFIIIPILIIFYLNIILQKPMINYIDEIDWICKNLMNQ